MRHGAGPDDDEQELRDRYQELLQELRTVLPGAQVLFAFLLTAPFSSRFTELDLFGQRLYTAALLGAGVSITLFQTPAAYHRVHGRNGRESRLRRSVKLTVVGMAILAASVTTSIFLVSRFVFDDSTMAGVLASVVAGTTVVLWYLVPLRERMRSSDDDSATGQHEHEDEPRPAAA